ncbi:MAG: hypothetical protein QM751_03555 [Paludibacteraceae bacterium]
MLLGVSILGYWGYLIDPTVNNNKTTWSSGFSGNPDLYHHLFERGSVSEYGFGWAGNFNNRVFLGANFNISSLEYRLESIISEKNNSGDNFRLNNTLNQSGTGVNLKIGAIALLTNDLRIGASIHTPTFYSISEFNDFELYSSKMESKDQPEIPSHIGSQKFQITSAFQAQGSIAYLFGKKGLLSAEYNFINYPGYEI